MTDSEINAQPPLTISIDVAHDGTTPSARLLLPANRPAASVIQILHGMAEHSGRYQQLAQQLLQDGHAVLLHDHRGHGNHPHKGHIDSRPHWQKRRRADGMRQPLGCGSGWWQLVNDAERLLQVALQHLPDKCPVMILGHSMGSYLAMTIACQTNIKLAGLILSGSGLMSPFSYRAGLLLTRTIAPFVDPKQPSRLMSRLVFGRFNSAFNDTESSWAWLSRDRQSVIQYQQDPLCGFDCSLEFWQCMLRGSEWLAREYTLGHIEKGLPIIMLSGEQDPVGGFGDGVRNLELALLRTGHDNLTTLLYPGGRHEMLNEINGTEVTNDLRVWIELQLRAWMHNTA